MGIEPTLPAWKAGALPLSYTRTFSGDSTARYLRLASLVDGGGSWIRTNVDVRQRVYSPSPLATRASPPT